MRTIDRSPTRFSSVVSTGAALLAVFASGLYSIPALAAGIAGIGLLVVGLRGGSRPMLSRGAAVVFVSTLLAGVQHAPTEVVLLSVTATVLAWDAGTTAISVGAHLGRDASTIRIEAIHLGSSLVVGALVVGGGYLLYQGATGQRPVAALVLLIVAAVLLLVAVQYEPDADSW